MNKLNSVSNVRIIKFQRINSRNYKLDIFSNINKLFLIKRVFTVKSDNKKTKNERGFHAHKNCEQIITCPLGEIQFKVFDGNKERKFKIKNNNKAIYVPNHIWTETTYLKSNTILICYCSEPYNEKSYIRNFETFLKFRKLKMK